MNDPSFPRRPQSLPPRPESVVQVVRRAPLSSIREVLDLSIHDVINEPRHKHVVAELYRVTRWIENERWLRGQIERVAGRRR